jgi:hypothetical protein
LQVLRRIAPFLVLAVALGLAHFEMWRAGPREVVPLSPAGAEGETRSMGVSDATFEAWLAARHARTWPTPWRLFDTPHCAPDDDTLTYGLPMLALGLLGAPAALFTREPVLVYNIQLVAWSAVAALAMYVLVSRWTGLRAAGLFAALLFAFHALRLDHIMHPTEWDIAWTALALCFAERLFRLGRWRDAAGLGVTGALQVATSFYPLLAAAFLALPVGIWLFVRRVPLRVTPAQAALALACVALAAAFVLGPYLVARGSERITARSEYLFLPWQAYAPGAPFFFGWVLLLGVLAGACVPRRLTLAGVGGDPRPALVAGALLVAFFAAGPHTALALARIGLPFPDFDPYSALARVIPGLDAIRVVGRLAAGVHLVACVLAGAAAAGLITVSGRYARATGAALVALALFACFGFPLPGPMRWTLEPIRPPQATIDFFARLEASGNSGPLFELPLDYVGRTTNLLASPRILMEAWHGRRTSACFGSYPQTGRDELAALADALPARDAAEALRARGFTTVVIHHPNPDLRLLPWNQKIEVAARFHDSPLQLLEDTPAMSAYALIAEPPPSPAPR